jgi:hypothetical protein
VNRLWHYHFGQGIVATPNDFGAMGTTATHPELLDWLAYDFMTHGYDFKHTIRLILTSRTYQLEYNPSLEDHFDIAKRKDPRYYRSPTLRRLTAEQTVDSTRLIKNQAFSPQDRLYKTTAATALSRALGRPASRNEVSTCRADDVAVVQSLELLNGKEFYDLVYANDRLSELLFDRPPDAQIQMLYMAVYDRPATDDELKAATQFLKTGAANPTTKPADAARQSLRDMLWAMITGPEFQYVY